MFSDEQSNKNMLLGAYKKLKSYYHYNKNFLFMREKIALFEYSSDEMDKSIDFLSKVLKDPSKYSTEIMKWMNAIDFYILPKSFAADKTIEDRFVTSSLPNKSVTKVNFFIDMPIELHLLETIWGLFIAKIAFDNNVFQDCSYGNVIDDKVLFDSSAEGLKESIRFHKNKMFKVYFPQYCAWKNNAIDAIEKNKKDKNTVLVSIDIKSFYYSVRWKFEYLSQLLPDERIESIISLTSIIESIFEKYTEKINAYRVLSQRIELKESALPIGLFSSMIIANIFLSRYDAEIKNIKNVLYYGRYVDDILLLINVKQKGFSADDSCLDNLLVSENEILSKVNTENYHLKGYDDLIIQREKLKVIVLECGKSEGIISQLRKTKLIPSQMNVVPSNDLQMADFEEAAYALHNFTTETKIRDLGQLEINRFKLSCYMAQLVRGSRYRTSHMASVEEKILRQGEKDKVIKFFAGSNAIEYNSNWINVLYFILLSSGGGNRRDWNNLEEGIRESIKRITIDHVNDIRKGKSGGIKTKMKKDLFHLFDICIATALAINPKFSKKEKREIVDLCYKIRSANLFNHYLVMFPLINYSDVIGRDVDLSNLSLAGLKEEYFSISDSRKIRLSPRFINFDELFHYAFIRSIVCESGRLVSEKVIENIRNTFFRVNHIDPAWAKPFAISITDEGGQTEDYTFRNITFSNKDRDLERVRIAVANIGLSIDSCCMGLDNLPVIRNRLDFISFLSLAYNNNIDKVDYIVFPEFYLPISWMQDVLSFSRKTGITVITGIQYIRKNKIAHNLVGVFARIKSGKYNSSCVLLREKNNYAPLEKKLVATAGYSVNDKKKPIYTCFNDGNVRFGVFLCYEFTDICARGLFKDKADIIFIPEYNNDTTYFSNIIDTMTRDIHAFMVQANTSTYGDSRISGPYDRDHRNVVQIKGGDNDSLIIGTINIQEIMDCRENERSQMDKEIFEILSMNDRKRKDRREELLKEHDIKISKTSARTFF